MAVLKPFEIAYKISAANALAESATDADASRFPSMYKALRGDGALIAAGTRINRFGKLYRARVDVWDSDDYAPENAPSLWEEILYRKGYRIITTITAEFPFMRGDRGWYNDELYESLIDNNVWTPTDYALGWKLIK